MVLPNPLRRITRNGEQAVRRLLERVVDIALRRVAQPGVTRCRIST